MTDHLDDELAWLPTGAHHLLLKGYSGAGIALVEDSRGGRFIRKIASTPGDSDRLRGQVDRQLAYRHRVDLVSVPDVLSCGEFDGRFYFDMQVVDGFDAATHLRTASFDAVVSISETLSELVGRSAGQGPLTESVPLRQALAAKLDELRLRLRARDPETQAALEGLDQLVATAPEDLAPTLCHGDLTLENVLVDRSGQVWVIDLTPPPFEHVWFDVAKLLQDLDGGWYLRSGRGMSSGVRSYVLRSILDAADTTGFAQHRHLMVCLTFARILPYVRNDVDRRFVLARLIAMLATPELQRVG